MKELKDTAHFEIGKTNYEFRKFNLNDEIWLRDNIDLEAIFSDPIDLEGLSRVMFHQLVDKSLFPARIYKDFDELGHEVEMQTGGLKSFRDVFSGQAEVLKMLNAFSGLLVLSRPTLTEDEEEETEKKQ